MAQTSAASLKALLTRMDKRTPKTTSTHRFQDLLSSLKGRATQYLFDNFPEHAGPPVQLSRGARHEDDLTLGPRRPHCAPSGHPLQLCGQGPGEGEDGRDMRYAGDGQTLRGLWFPDATRECHVC